MKTHVVFRSADFRPYDEEAAQINPGRYGKRVAELLIRGLAERGIEPLELIAEDWGWVIPIKNDSFKVWIGCGNYEDYTDGFLCFIGPHKPTVVRRFLALGRIDVSAKVMKLQTAIDQVLSVTPGVRDIKWSTSEAFNTPQ